jgi:hypothetical protein
LSGFLDTPKITLYLPSYMKKKRVGKVKYDKTIYIDYILYNYYSVYPTTTRFGVLSGVLSESLTKLLESRRNMKQKLTEKCRKHLPKDVVDLLERPDVVELVRYFNGRLVSYKSKDQETDEQR